jgi:hypothetical protein
MKFALAKEHHDFFDKEGYIEFEELISPANLEKIEKAVRQLVGTRINQFPERLSHESPIRLYTNGRDLWRSHPEIKKQCANRNFASIAAGLVREKSLRLALDQWIPPGFDWKNASTLEDLVPIQGVVAGAFIALNSGITNDEPSIFPSNAGHVLFVKPGTPLPLNGLSAQRNQSFLLVVYGSPKSVYIHKESDPLTHYLKEHGYVYGDRLSDHLHPILLQ